MPFPLLFWKTWLLSSWGLSFPYHHEGSNSLWSVVPAKWRSCQAGVGCPEIWRGSAHLVVKLGVFQEDQKRGMALRGCGTSWTEEGKRWGFCGARGMDTRDLPPKNCWVGTALESGRGCSGAALSLWELDPRCQEPQETWRSPGQVCLRG